MVVTHIARPSSSALRRAVLALGFALACAMPTMAQDGFAVFGEEGVWLQQNSTVLSGDVGVNLASPDGPFLSGASELTVDPGGFMVASGSLVIGNQISLGIGSQIQDVHANDVSGIGTVLGTVTMPLTFPVVDSLPPVPAVTPGTDDVDVPLFTTDTLDAGAYGALTVGAGATLTLTGGLYELASCTVGNSAKLLFDAAAEVRVAGRLMVDHIARVEPSPDAATLTAADILIVVTGINGVTGALDESPLAATFGQATTSRARVYVPNGTLEVQQNSQLTGALLGRWVVAGPGVGVQFEGGFGLPLVAGGAKFGAGSLRRTGKVPGLPGPFQFTPPGL